MKSKLFGIAGALVVLLALGLVLAGCDNGTTNDGPDILKTYTFTQNGYSYELVILDDGTYKLTGTNGTTTVTSAGTSSGETGGTMVLTPEGETGSSITVTPNGGGAAIEVAGDIPFKNEDGTPAEGLPSLEGEPQAAGTYHLRWGVIDTSYGQVQSIIGQQNWTIAASGTGWALATGATATSVYNWCNNPSNIPSNAWLDGGDLDGSFTDLVNFSSNGVGLPAGLKNSQHTAGANVPLAGIFDGGAAAGYAVILFYVTGK
ncbi:MAG: hypothetical protein LBI91_01460 [Spirochaetaceae bacterium]|jgi:hypothetical protein|nr:hypothetical protein [Spirochaetaceae bacterium]